jgi:hypothetical protein
MLKVMSLIISPPACPFTKERKITQKAIKKLYASKNCLVEGFCGNL